MEQCSQHKDIMGSLIRIQEALDEIKIVLKGDYEKDGLTTRVKQIEWRINELEKLRDKIKDTAVTTAVKLITAAIIGSAVTMGFYRLW